MLRFGVKPSAPFLGCQIAHCLRAVPRIPLASPHCCARMSDLSSGELERKFRVKGSLSYLHRMVLFQCHLIQPNGNVLTCFTLTFVHSE